MLMKKFAVIFVLISNLFYLTPFAHAADADNLANLLNAVKTMQANFTQTVSDEKNKVLQTSYGKMAMQRPGKFRWDIKKPIPQLIIANETKLWIYDADLQQVTIRSLSKAAGETPALLLTDVDRVLTKDYIVKPPKTEANITWYGLQPRSADNMFASVALGFANNQLNEMRLVDHLGHVTRVQFSQTQINKPLAATLFTYKASANVDVVDETKPN